MEAAEDKENWQRKLKNDSVFGEEVLGGKKRENGEDLIL